MPEGKSAHEDAQPEPVPAEPAPGTSAQEDALPAAPAALDEAMPAAPAAHAEAPASNPPWVRPIAIVTSWLRARFGSIGAGDVRPVAGRSGRAGIRGRLAPPADESPVGERAQTAVRRILRGDRPAFEAVVAALAGNDPRLAAYWQELLDRLFEVILEQALDAGYLDPPRRFPFWAAFTVEQGRDIMKALGSLGFRVDGRGAWLDERVPTRRDLSIAVGYAGVDPVRVRTWPAPEELAALGGDVVVAGADYLDVVAPGLSRAEVSGLAESAGIGPGLDDLWEDWDRVRPLLLAVG